MPKGIFVTGTSTGVGKTVISALICKKLLDDKNNVVYYKPLQTGGLEDNSVSVDCRFVESTAGNVNGFKTFSSYIFKKPASPHLASRLENRKIEKQKIAADYEELSKNTDYIVAEGAGGIMVPADENGFMTYDIPQMLSLNIVLVGSAGLGTINHVLLNDFFIKSKGMKISAIILITENEKPDDIEADNFNFLKKKTGVRDIYLMPKIKDIDTEENKPGNFSENLKHFPDAQNIKRWFYE
jgi:dethiobiotin synthetase